MKKIYSTLIALLAITTFSHAQNNFPSNGDATLGVQGYFGNVLRFEGLGESHAIRTESIGNSGNGNTRLRMYLGDDWTYNQGFEIVASRWDGAQRSLFYIPGDGSQARFYSGAYFGSSVGIGITNIPTGYSFAVGGNAIAESVTVKLQGSWPDYVFKPKYSLPSLAAVKSFIDMNQRLPGMPSETEVAKNGINLGEIVKIQTKKIEELTLYLIEKDKQVNDQNNKLIEQEKTNKSFQEQINKLTKQLAKRK